MKKETTALLLGRFQPFHLGHLDAIQQVFDSGVETLLIGIGSSQISHEPDNPFTAGERWQMIYRSLLKAGFTTEQFHIMPLADIAHNHLWPHFVQQQSPPFSTIFSGSKWVLELFNNALPAIKTTELKQQKAITATAVRTAILDGKILDDLVPSETITILQELEAQTRLKNITHRGFS